MKILLAIDGSASALDAAALVVKHAKKCREPVEIELINVQYPVLKLPFMRKVVSKQDIENFYLDEGNSALAGARDLFDEAGIAYSHKVLAG